MILFSSLTLLSVLLNVGLVSLVIFCQTRYTKYGAVLYQPDADAGAIFDPCCKREKGGEA